MSKTGGGTVNLADLLNKIIENESLTIIRLQNGINENIIHIEDMSNVYKKIYDFLNTPEYKIDKILDNHIYDAAKIYTMQAKENFDKIYDVFFTKPAGIFKKRKTKSVTQMDMEKAKSYYNDLIVIKERLDEYLKILLWRLNSI